jgi:predicted transposase/invertase (TIGR01784 family)
LRLDAKEEKSFQLEIDKLEPKQKEIIMENLTIWEEKGIEKGMEKGMERERNAIALKMLQANLPLEQVSNFTGLTIAQLHQVQS